MELQNRMLDIGPDVLTTTEAAAQLAQVKEELDSERGRPDELAHSYALLQGRWEEGGQVMRQPGRTCSSRFSW